MMEIAIYLIGVVASYFSMRASIKYITDGEWTFGSRAFALFVSLTSFGGVAVAGIMAIIHITVTSDRPVKW